MIILAWHSPFSSGPLHPTDSEFLITLVLKDSVRSLFFVDLELVS